MPAISIIIPCYNQGEYVDEAIQSVLDQTFQDIEIIVINDGSTDSRTAKRLQSLEYPKTRVIHSANAGLPSARNLGIKNASGEFILPLDADDKIASTYLEKALAVITNTPEIGIVYCKGWMFGDMTGPWDLPDYEFPKILLFPLIHCCGLFRRADWEQVGGYCAEMIHGWEDYDFWLSLLELGRKVHRIPEPLFYYRQHPSSMVKSLDQDLKDQLSRFIVRRHWKLYDASIVDLLARARSGYITSTREFEVGRKVLRPFKEVGRVRRRFLNFLTHCGLSRIAGN